MALASELDTYWAELSPMRARLVVRFLASPGETVTGYVSGPECLLTATLPVKLPLRVKAGAEVTSAEALLTDLCFWTPELPLLYRVHVERRAAGGEVVSEQLVGARAFHTQGPNLYVEGKRRVLRGAADEHVQTDCAEAWHKSGLARLVDDPSDELCDELSRQGVLVVARVREEPWAEALPRLAQHAAVAIAVLAGNDLPAADVRRAARQLLLAQEFRLGEPVAASAWAHLTFCHVDDPENFIERARDDELPLIAYRPLTAPVSLAAARAACDKLQASLPLLGRYAGYIV